MEEKPSSEVILYETRHHASRPYTPNYPPVQLKDGAAKGGLLSLLSTRGLSQIKEKWSGFRPVTRPRRLVSLLVSPKGERVAIMVGSHITILRKDDDYQSPFAMFASSSPSTFIHGAWSESHDVLGVADDNDTLYFIKATGDEVIRMERRHLKLQSSIIYLFVTDDCEKSVLCSFNFLTSDGSLHQIEIGHDLSASISSMRTWTDIKMQLAQMVSCAHYDPECSLLAVVGTTASISQSTTNGSYILSLWYWSQNSELKLVNSIQCEGLYTRPKDYTGPVTYPKVLISPQGQFVAAIDLRGCLDVSMFEKDTHSMSVVACGRRGHSKVGSNISSVEREFFNDVADFTWWSGHILCLARRGGAVIMFDIIDAKKCIDNNPVFSLPLLERQQRAERDVFLLDVSLPEDKKSYRDNSEMTALQKLEQDSEGKIGQLELSKLRWNLISFSERSVPEMYDVLIKTGNYQSALDFADRHKLDKDQVLKSQWLLCEQGTSQINLLLSKIKDKQFVLGECVERVGLTEDAVRALLGHGLRLTDSYKFSGLEDSDSDQIWDFRLLRLQLLQFRDRLETFLGINMGRFSVQGYRKFRLIPINEAAADLAENGKIGALNLLFKRHPYTLTPFMLEVLADIPETIFVQTYNQLLPGRSPFPIIALREKDWVECDAMAKYIRNLPQGHDKGVSIITEYVFNQIKGLLWPSSDVILEWYKNRARDIDRFSGQIDNSLCLIDFGCRKGIYELQQFYEDILYLQQLIYSGDGDYEVQQSINLAEWECLSDYEKFKVMLKNVKEENVIERLHDKAIPFMQKRSRDLNTSLDGEHEKDESFLVRWMKEIAIQNNIDICSVVIDEGCKDFHVGYFRHEVEAIECALQCIYACSSTDKWNTMASIISKFPTRRGVTGAESYAGGLDERLKLVEGHIEAGRLLALYQVPKPVKFFLECHKDEKSVKQVLRLILSKFIRRQSGCSDNDWAAMWHDLYCLQEKAFPFLNPEYMLIEFCRGLLKAGKFSLARNYLKGTSSISLPAEKAENLVIQTAREYFFSASSLSCSEIWKARECLDLLPSSRNVRAEANIIDALTVNLPNLGVHILPLQYKQVKDPMEIVKMAITSQAGAYLNVDEIIEVAKLLGLSSQEDVSAVQEAIAREAAVAGDLQLAFDLCIVLARKGHGLIWDLCAALARGPAIENMDISSRKQLLGFALSQCDDESISELLHAWKDLDMQGQSDSLMMLTGTGPPNFTVQGSSVISLPGHSAQHLFNLRDCSELVDGSAEDDQDDQFRKIKDVLSQVAKDLPVANGSSWDDLLRENGKVLSFAALQLPWLVQLSSKAELGKKFFPVSIPGKYYVSVRTQSVVTILSWLARHGFAPRDDLIASLAKSIMEPPVSEEEDIMGCSILLNLMDAFYGVDIIEQQLKTREDYLEVNSIMNVGMIYSLLSNAQAECKDPLQRREVLLTKFSEKIGSDELDKMDKTQSTFWRDWKLKLEEQKLVADCTRVLVQLIPGVEASRFVSGDLNYIRGALYSFIDSVKLEKKHILKDVLKLADTYSLNRSEVLSRFLCAVLVSDAWKNDEIAYEISEVKEELLDHAHETIKTLSSIVYPEIDGCNKTRLAFVYGLLADCYLQLQEQKELAQFYRVLEQECYRVSFIMNLNFKNIANIRGLNQKCFTDEVCSHINEFNVEALGEMVQKLVRACTDPGTEDLMSWQAVYKIQALTLFEYLENKVKTSHHLATPESFQGFLNELEQTYDTSRKHIKVLGNPVALDIMKKYFTVVIPLKAFSEKIPDDFVLKECLVVLLNFWIRLTDDMREFASKNKFSADCSMACLKAFLRLVMEGKVTARQSWGTVCGYAECGILRSPSAERFYFCRAMVLSGCAFAAIEQVFSEALLQCSEDLVLSSHREGVNSAHEVCDLYLDMLESTLGNLVQEARDCLDLQDLLSSLSRLEGDLNVLKKVRQAVWERLAKFSDDMQLASHARVYILEVMQLIIGRNLKGTDRKHQNILPWEGWDEWNTRNNSEVTSDQLVSYHSDASSKFKNTLVALKATELAAEISPSFEISPDDLQTVDSTVSCFLKLCESSTSELHIDSLLAVLAQFESLFVADKTEEAASEASNEGITWGDDWDEGWGSHEEEPAEKRKESSLTLSTLNPLHSCWLEIFRKLVSLSKYNVLLQLIDQSLAKPNGVVIDEDDTHNLSEMLLESDCLLALKMTLLLPYEAIQLHCLDIVEEKLKQGGFAETCFDDHEFFVLVLSSGIISTIISRLSYGATFSYVCYLVGHFSRQSQEAQLSWLNQSVASEHDNEEEEFWLIFRKILFPCFVSELVRAGQHVLAGFLVTKSMHTSPSLSVINVAEAGLFRYLKMQIQTLDGDIFSSGGLNQSRTLRNAISGLQLKLKDLVESALTSLPSSK